MLTKRVLDAGDDWSEAVELKRRRAYEDVMATASWSWDEVDAVYRDHWGPKGIDFHAMMLEKAAEGGELLAWNLGERMVAYAAVRLTPLCRDDGPLACITGDLLVLPDLPREGQVEVIRDLIEYGQARGAVTSEFTGDAFLNEALVEAGMTPQKAVMRWAAPSHA